MKISVIIPVLNEERIIEKNLISVLGYSGIEVILVDGGSQDNTVFIAQNMGVKVIFASQTGRASQMNQGALAATGDTFLFLHADTILPKDYPSIVKKILSEPTNIVGAFQLKIDSNQLALRLVEKLVNWRSRFLSLPYGDQAIFLKESVFQEMGGFADLPIMEDFVLIQKLKKQGKITIASEKVITSSRRWQKLGILKTTIINQLVILGYYWGISPHQLAQFYRRK
ncbi:MAG: TIGR04283 family arsenosugar biosynthesis glycosyltransferase [Cyanobacteria bacterium P01_G01_bin.49]